MKNSLTRFAALALALVLAAGALAGCASASPITAAATGKSDATEAAATTTAPAPTEAALEPVNLIWYLRNDKPANADAVVAAANKLIGEAINATVDFRFISGGDYNDKMNLILQASEEFDICFTASWSNNYVQNVNSGAYIPLDGYIEQYPDIKSLVSDELWGAIRINGKIYGVPNLQVMYNQMGMFFRKDLIDKYKIDLAAVKTVDDLTPVFQTIKDNEPDVYPLASTCPSYYFTKYAPTFDEVLGVDTSTWKVYDRRSVDYVANYKAIRQWQQKGFLPSDAATLKDEDSLIKAGKVFSRYQRMVPGGEATIKAKYGFDVVMLAITDSIIEQNSVRSTLDAISVTSKNPDRAFMLLNLMFTNKEIYNTMVFGIDGQDYKKLSDTRIEQIPDQYSAPAWQLGNQFNAYLLPGQPDDVWEITKKNNDAAKFGEMGSFVFDPKNVEAELANVNAVNTEFDTMLDYGLDETDTILAKRAEKLNQAGFEKLVAEMQTQVDAWVAANKK